jgi:hypothetical protein
VAVAVGCATLGALATVVTGGEPGMLLGVFLVAGTVVAGIAVHQRASFLIIPVPALAYLVAALAAGIASGHANASKATLAVGAVQWIARGFPPMLAATALAMLIAGARWWLSRRRFRA